MDDLRIGGGNVLIPNPNGGAPQLVTNLTPSGVGNFTQIPVAPSPLPVTRQVGGDPTAPFVTDPRDAAAAQLAELSGLFNSGPSTSSTSSSSSTTNTTNSTSTTIQRVLNEAAREAAFNRQRDETAGAFSNQITSIGETLTGLLELLSGLQQEQIAGVDEQERLAGDNTNRQVEEGTGVIDTELANLLTSLADGEARIRAEQELVTNSIAGQRTQDLQRITAQDRALRALGGGDELAGATQGANARAQEIASIDGALAQRLASSAAQGFTRRRDAAATTASAARTDLSNSAALILAQIGAAAAQQRNAINVNTAQAELGLQQQFDQQILEAQLQRDLAQAQTFIPEPVRESTTTSSSTSTSRTSGGSTTTNSGGGGVDPIQSAIIEAQLPGLLQEAGLVSAPQPTVQQVLDDTVAAARLDALNGGDLRLFNELG